MSLYQGCVYRHSPKLMMFHGTLKTKTEVRKLLTYLNAQGRWTPGRTIVTDTRKGEHYIYHHTLVAEMDAFVNKTKDSPC